MNCPRCGQQDVTGADCPRCGIVFAKLQARPRREAASALASPSARPRSSGFPWGLIAFCLGLTALGALGAWALLRPAQRPPAAPGGAPPVSSVSTADVAPPTFVAVAVAPPVEAAVVEPAGIAESDRTLAKSLSEKVNRRDPMGEGELKAAEDLFSRYPGEAPVRTLLEAVLLTAAVQDREHRRFPEAVSRLRRAAVVQAGAIRPRMALLGLLLETGNWGEAEAVAREILALEPRNGDAYEGLAFALFRQDRNRESSEALRAALEIRPSSSAQDLLERIQKNLADEKGMTEQRLSHFHVRYDGDAHEDVGREILRALERHYSTLAGALDHQPSAAIPVILFSRERYYDASGAPAWSGGVFDQIDGRIRIPIGGLTAGLTPDIDDVLVHELTHAFIHDRSRSLAPRDIHEGLAQYMEGKRLGSELTPEQLTALADGRLGGVGGFYLGALSFVEHLMSSRGQGGMNDLLKAMGDAGDVNEAFRQVHGHDYAGARRVWIERLKQQYGS